MSLGELIVGDLKVIGALAFLNAISTSSEQKNEDSGEMVLIASPTFWMTPNGKETIFMTMPPTVYLDAPATPTYSSLGFQRMQVYLSNTGKNRPVGT